MNVNDAVKGEGPTIVLVRQHGPFPEVCSPLDPRRLAIVAAGPRAQFRCARCHGWWMVHGDFDKAADVGCPECGGVLARC